MKFYKIIIAYFFCVMTIHASEASFLRSVTLQAVTVFTSRNPQFQDALLIPLLATTQSIKGLAYTLTNKHIIEALLQKASEGVSVDLVVDASVFSTVRRYIDDSYMVLDEVRGLNKGLLKLIEHDHINVSVYNGEGNGLMHCKSFILEGVKIQDSYYNLVHSGSANCTHAGLNGTNCEVSHLFNEEDVYKDYEKLFTEIKNTSKSITLEKKINQTLLKKNKKSKKAPLEIKDYKPTIPRTVTVQRISYKNNKRKIQELR